MRRNRLVDLAPEPGQNPSRNPNRISRDRPTASAADCVEVIFPKLELLALPFGFAKCGVLLRLNDSPRNCKFTLSVTLKVRNRLKSVFTTPGPRMVLRPIVPNRTPVGRANAV